MLIPIMLNLVRKPPVDNLKKNPISRVLTRVPEKLKMKEGERKVPRIKELINTRERAIFREVPNPILTRATRVIKLARPSRTPGTG